MLIKLVKVCVTICCLLALSIWLAGCNHIDQATNPTPQPITIEGILQLETDSNGQVNIPLDQLGLSRRAAFTLDASGFKDGAIILSTDSTLAYKAIIDTNWQVDSGAITVTQGGATATRRLLVHNFKYQDPAVQATCVNLGNVLIVQVPYPGQAFLSQLPGYVTGAKIDSVGGVYHQATISADSTMITYNPVGGGAAGYYLGFDQLTYRIRLPNGAGCRTASVRFIIPDSCSLPKAKFDYVQGTAPEIRIPHSQLYANDLSCDGFTVPVQPLIRLGFRHYTPPLMVRRKWGTLTDTVDNGVPTFIYRNTNPLVRNDTVQYYMQDQSNDRITTTTFIIHLN